MPQSATVGHTGKVAEPAIVDRPQSEEAPSGEETE